MIRRLVGAGIAALTAGAACGDDGPYVMDPGRAEGIESTCRAEPDVRIDRQVFAGADVPNSPAHALALFWKWHQLGILNFNAPRADLDRIVAVAEAIEICVVYDAMGHPLGGYWANEGVRQVSWWRREDTGGATCLREHRIESGAERAGSLICATKGAAGLLEISGNPSREPETALDIARFVRTGAGWRLEIRWRKRHVTETVTFAPDGLPATCRLRTCYNDDQPCPDIRVTAATVFDATGNLVSREITGPDFRQSDRFVLHKNDRGDRVARHWPDYTHPDQVTVRASSCRD